MTWELLTSMDVRTPSLSALRACRCCSLGGRYTIPSPGKPSTFGRAMLQSRRTPISRFLAPAVGSNSVWKDTASSEPSVILEFEEKHRGSFQSVLECGLWRQSWEALLLLWSSLLLSQPPSLPPLVLMQEKGLLHPPLSLCLAVGSSALPIRGVCFPILSAQPPIFSLLPSAPSRAFSNPDTRQKLVSPAPMGRTWGQNFQSSNYAPCAEKSISHATNKGSKKSSIPHIFRHAISSLG